MTKSELIKGIRKCDSYGIDDVFVNEDELGDDYDSKSVKVRRNDKLFSEAKKKEPVIKGTLDLRQFECEVDLYENDNRFRDLGLALDYKGKDIEDIVRVINAYFDVPVCYCRDENLYLGEEPDPYEGIDMDDPDFEPCDYDDMDFEDENEPIGYWDGRQFVWDGNGISDDFGPLDVIQMCDDEGYGELVKHKIDIVVTDKGSLDEFLEEKGVSLKDAGIVI